MSTSSKAIGAVVRGEIAHLLRQHQFKKDGRTFRKQVGPIILIVNIQASHGNSAAEASFYVNLSIYSTEIAQLMGDAPNPKPKEYDGHVRRRLEPEGAGDWTLTAATNLEVLSQEVAQLLEQDGLPWLEAGADRRLLMNHPKLRIGVEGIAVALLGGDLREAQARLERTKKMLSERSKPQAAENVQAQFDQMRERLDSLS